MRSVAAVLFAVLVSTALAELPRFRGPFAVRDWDSGILIDVGLVSAPLMYDWDGDGRKDLLCGQFDSGKIRFYPNVGLDTAPEFDGYRFLRADSADITFPSI
jgi:hypothetical protein